MTTALSALQLKHVTKSFGATHVFSELQLVINRGETVLIIGPNGSGKSTFLKLCAGLLKPNNGTIENFGLKTNFLGHEPFVYDQLTVRENLELFAGLCNSNLDITSVLVEWNLKKYANNIVADLSKGTLSRTGLARTFLSNSDILLLDEPTSSLDEESVDILKTKILHLSEQGKTCILASHDITRAKELPTRVLLLDGGKILQDSQSGMSINDTYSFYFGINK